MSCRFFAVASCLAIIWGAATASAAETLHLVRGGIQRPVALVGEGK